MGLETISKKDMVLIGQTEMKGHGVGLSRETGARLTERSLHAIMHTLSTKSVNHADAFIVVAGLGGGTGSGGAPVIARRLREVYDEPVYALGILPSAGEGRLMAGNALAATEELLAATDGVIVFDNDVWQKEGHPIQQSYNIMNHELTRPLPVMLGAGEASNGNVGVKVIDASDIIRTWKGLSVLGYSEMKVKGLKERLFPFKDRKTSLDQLDPVLKCKTIIRNATTIKLSSDCEVRETAAALMIIAGPPREISTEGFHEAKSWLQNYTQAEEVRGGDYPVPSSSDMAAVVMLSGFDDLPCLAKLREARGNGNGHKKLRKAHGNGNGHKGGSKKNV
jgi:cell division GTPase FtsZ